MTVAKRELLEETGYVSDDWQYIGATVESSAKLTNYMHLFLPIIAERLANRILTLRKNWMFSLFR